MQAVILAGGLGTRLRPLTLSVPKPMVEISGKPFLDYEIRHLKQNGFDDFLIAIGYKGEMIRNHFKEGRELGVSIAYSYDGKKQLGPAGALKNAADLLDKEFMVTYGDSFLRLDYSKFIDAFHSSGRLGMMSVLENRNKFGRSDLVVSEGLVTKYDKKNQSNGMNWINYGATILQKKSLNYIPDNSVCGEVEFYGKLIAERQLAAFETHDRFYEIGTPAGLKEFEDFLSKNPQQFE
jgi:NDP-sugar pyrophosphorylase family protein